MVDLPHPDDLSRFSEFNILATTYKTGDSYAIKVNVLVPKGLTSPSKGSPLIIRFHGGGFITGSSIYPGFFSRHLLEFAQKHSAIIISPDYRLLPEARQSDILCDVEDSWQWIHSTLATYLERETKGTVTPNLTRIITTGDSAGGYLSLQLGLSHPHEIRAVTAAYPCIDLKSPFFTTHYEKHLFDVPQLDFTQILEAHTSKTQAASSATATTVRSEDPNLDAVLLMFAAIQHGVIPELYFDMDDPLQFPLERIERGETFPKGGVLVWHGKWDSVVPIEGSRKFKETLLAKDPEARLTLIEAEGDHGYDSELSLEAAGLAGPMEDIAKVWLA